MLSFNSYVLSAIAGLLLTSLALLRARQLRTAKLLQPKVALRPASLLHPKVALRPASLLRDSAH